MKQFTLQIPKGVQTDLEKFRASIKQSIRRRLREIVDELTARPPAPGKDAPVHGPPLRFYVSEGCRVSYQVNPITRRVVVLDLKAENS
jgi:hypothetical protein